VRQAFPSPSVKVSITNVNVLGDKYVQIANNAVGAWEPDGMEAGLGRKYNNLYLPAFSLDNGLSVKVHEGSGSGTATDMYTNRQRLCGSINVCLSPGCYGRCDILIRHLQSTRANRIC